MSALIDLTAGRAAIAYVGDKPWHGLGAELVPGSPLEVWRKAAGLDWDGVKVPVMFRAGDDLQTASDHAVIYRSDTRAVLGVVGDGYKVVQPVEALEFYRDLTEKFGYQLETAGGLKGGRLIWALAKTGTSLRVMGTDVIDEYVLFSTSFDGSRGTNVRPTKVRVVCYNTFSAATAAEGGVSVSHRSIFNAAEAKRKLQLGAHSAEFEDAANRMAETKVEPQQQVEFLLKVYHGLTVQDAAKLEDKAKTAVDKTVTRLANILANAAGQRQSSAGGTLWGLFNSVTFDVDHEKPARSQDNRLTSAWFGDGDSLKRQAWAEATSILTTGTLRAAA